MTLTIDLPPDLEKTVRQQAAKNGQDVGAFVVQAVNEKLAVTPVTTPTTRGLADVIDEIRQGQLARGFQGRSPEEIEAVRKEGEAEYEQRMQALHAVEPSTAEGS